jgi:hypothetical protein
VEDAIDPGEDRALRRVVLAAHVAGLPLSLALGFALCGRDLGWSDSLVIARSPLLALPHPSFLEYVAGWYTHLNGRLSQAVVASLVRLPFAGAARPEDFPFWLFAGLSFFCAFTTVALVGCMVARCGHGRAAGGLTASWLLAVWATNPVSFENVTYHHLAIFLAYLLPGYLTALWLWHTLDLAFRRPSRLGLALHLAGYFVVSNFVEVVLFSAPLLGLLAWAAAPRERSRAFWLRLVACYAALSVGSAAIYWFSPGQRIRAAIGVVVPREAGALLSRLVELVSVRYWGLSPTVGAISYAASLVLVVGVLALARRHGRWRGTAMAAGVLFLAHVAALAPAVFVNLAARTVILPALLLVASLALALLAALGIAADATRSAVSAAGAARGRRLALAGVTALALAAGAVQVGECASVQHRRRWLSGVRRRLYTYVVALHDGTRVSSFVLTACDLAPERTPIEPPWGLQAYFGWVRSPQLSVLVDTNYDYPSALPGGGFTQVSCRDFVARRLPGEAAAP